MRGVMECIILYAVYFALFALVVWFWLTSVKFMGSLNGMGSGQWTAFQIPFCNILSENDTEDFTVSC